MPQLPFRLVLSWPDEWEVSQSKILLTVCVLGLFSVPLCSGPLSGRHQDGNRGTGNLLGKKTIDWKRRGSWKRWQGHQTRMQASVLCRKEMRSGRVSDCDAFHRRIRPWFNVIYQRSPASCRNGPGLGIPAVLCLWLKASYGRCGLNGRGRT